MIVGAVVIGFGLAGLVIGGLYWLTWQVDDPGLRWWAVAATLAVPGAIVITWRLATHAAREHLSGFERGLSGAEKTITSVGRGLSASASMARAARGLPTARPTNDDLLPRVGRLQIIDARSGNELIDL